MLVILYACLAMFASTLLSGFRSRCIALDQPKQAAVAGAIQTAGELAVVALIATSPTLELVVLSSVAAGLGYYISMILHTRMNRKFFAEQKAKKKAKRKARLEKAIRKHKTPAWALESK